MSCIIHDEDLSPEDWAGLWGCEPTHDLSPNEPGDGVMFYNFSSETLDRNPEWLLFFLSAIERTLLSIKDMVSDYQNMLVLKKYVQDMLIERIKADNIHSRHPIMLTIDDEEVFANAVVKPSIEGIIIDIEDAKGESVGSFAKTWEELGDVCIPQLNLAITA